MSISSDTVNEKTEKSERGDGGGELQTTDLPDVIQRKDSIQSNASSTTTKTSERLRATVASATPEPPDGGWGWMIVVGSILTGALVPSLFMCFGVFMNAFLVVFPEASKSSAAWIPSIMTSLMNCMGPITSGLVNLYSARVVTLAGGITLSTGLVLSYFTSSLEALYFTYGILGGIGAGLSIAPGLYLISQYFKNRRGLATGVCMAGSSIGQIVTPYLIQILLDEYNYRGCILILGGLTLNICVTAALYRPLQSIPKVPKNTMRKRTASACSHRSSLTFLPDEGVCMTKNGNYAVMSTKNSNSKKHNDPKKKRHKKSKHTKRKKKNQSGANKNEIQAILLENTWNSIKQNDNMAPTRSRSRTLSLDSSRILPDIPEEREEDDGGGNSDTEQKEDLTDENSKLADVDEVNIETPAVTEYHNSSTVIQSTISPIPTITDICKDNENVQNNQRTSISVSVVPVDCGSDSAKHKYVRSVSMNESAEVVSLHNCYGSVASIASLGPSVNERESDRSVLKSISQFFGLSYFKYGIFYVLSASFTLLIVALGNYTMFIPTYGHTINLSKDVSAGLISVIAVASMCGRLILPTIPDYVNIRRKNIYFVSCMFTAGAVLLTIFATSYEILLVALVVFGFTSGGSVALSIGVFLDYVALDKFTAFFGLVQFIVGTILLFSTPLMGFLVDTTKSYTMTFCTLTAVSGLSGCVLYLDRFTDYESLSSPSIKPRPNPV